jgi:alanine racemase
MVDVTHLPEVQAGDVAVVYGPGLMQRATQLSDSIVYELLCRVSPRIPRIYLEHGQQV